MADDATAEEFMDFYLDDPSRHTWVSSVPLLQWYQNPLRIVDCKNELVHVYTPFCHQARPASSCETIGITSN